MTAFSGLCPQQPPLQRDYESFITGLRCASRPYRKFDGNFRVALYKPPSLRDHVDQFGVELYKPPSLRDYAAYCRVVLYKPPLFKEGW